MARRPECGGWGALRRQAAAGRERRGRAERLKTQVEILQPETRCLRVTARRLENLECVILCRSNMFELRVCECVCVCVHTQREGGKETMREKRVFQGVRI